LRYTDPNGHCLWDLCAAETALLYTAATAVAAGAIYYAEKTGEAIAITLTNAGCLLPEAGPVKILRRRERRRLTKPTQKQTMVRTNARNVVAMSTRRLTKRERKHLKTNSRHHKEHKKEGGSGTPENGEVLCPECHKGEHVEQPPPPPPRPLSLKDTE
jgi:hypothetical protein